MESRIDVHLRRLAAHWLYWLAPQMTPFNCMSSLEWPASQRMIVLYILKAIRGSMP